MTERPPNPLRSLYAPGEPAASGLGTDGVFRTASAERMLNAKFHELFHVERGQQVLDYLKSITINQVNGPRVTDGELRHMEGQRFIVALIERRISHGNDALPNLPEPQPQPIAGSGAVSSPGARTRRRRNPA